MNKKPLDDALKLFFAKDIPVWGEAEEEIDPLTWQQPDTGCDEKLPGEGLKQHPMLYIGEGHNKMSLILDGKEVWSFCAGKGFEYDDVWMLTNGNIVFSRMYWAAEITPQKKYVWRMEAPEGTEIHVTQPIGLDKVMMVLNAAPLPRVIIYNKKNGEIEYEHEIPYDTSCGVHGQFRRFRITAEGTFLAACLSMGKVVEYNRDFEEIWSYDIRTPWAAVRLKNGNTLINSEKEELIREVNPAKETVWQFCFSELPEEYSIASSQSCVRLDNGNTVICSMGDNGRTAQLVEITPDKEIVWVLKDWKNLGPATAVQILDEAGIPENPGECQR